jgi:hypothetical protein
MNTAVADSFVRLRVYNIIVGTFHLLQGLIVLMLSNDFSLPVTATFMDGPPWLTSRTADNLFSIRMGWSVAAFLFISAFAHYVVASPRVFGWYRDNLLKSRNYARWIEYAVSSSLMMMLIAMLPGITDVAALLGIFFTNAGMILFGLLMEHYEEPGNPNWTSYGFGIILGVIPWAAVGLYLWSPTTAASPPGFVYIIFFSIFAFFNIFAINMLLQYKRVGPWRNYLFGESIYILLSLTSKSALAWQVFAGTLAS